MDTQLTTEAMVVARLLDREMEMVRGAISMVAAGGAPSVLVGGLRFGEEMLRHLDAEARRSAVTLQPVWRLDCHGCAIRVVRHP